MLGFPFYFFIKYHGLLCVFVNCYKNLRIFGQNIAAVAPDFFVKSA